MDIVELEYVQGIVQDASSVPTGMLEALITSLSGMVERFCRRSFHAHRYVESYDGNAKGTLSLRFAPLVELNSITLYPDGPAPQTYTAASFDILYAQARLNFKPGVNGSFFNRYYPEITLPAVGLNSTLADYFAGYGFVTTLTGDISAGSNIVLPLANNNGYVPDQGPWNIANSWQLLLDAGTQNEEVVQINVNSSEVTATNLVNDHSAGAYVCGQLVPADVQLACALLVGNAIHAQDLTKAGEQVGRLGGYVWQGRSGSYLFTPEIKRLLTAYQDAIQ
ncbi:MAG TPA: hypothetical protein VMG59_13850 [Phycisphaerae bacterium]|nr:hypothetical protein [Phycisphaerae bacterium]